MFKRLVMFVAGVAILTLFLATAFSGEKKQPGQAGREYPIAAGIWYPHKGEVPDRPMRYYRVRCWPGCHSGSSYGVYPEPLEGDQPVFPTSTIDLK